MRKSIKIQSFVGKSNREATISGREALKIQKLICEIYQVGREHFTKYDERGEAICVK